MTAAVLPIMKRAVGTPGLAAWRQLSNIRRRAATARIVRRRIASVERRLLPDTIILGAQRAGTTALFDRLARQPSVLASCAKEVHFFDLGASRRIGWYRAHFPLEKEAIAIREQGLEPVVLEASPYYLFHPAVPQRMVSVLPDARFIVLLREPVARAWSHYWHERTRGYEWRSPEVAFAREEERLKGEAERLLADPHYHSYRHRHFAYLGRSRYAEQLRRWFEWFPKERFLILKAEDVFGAASPGMHKVCEFLGLPVEPITGAKASGARNAGSYAGMPSSLHEKIASQLEQPNAELRALLGPEFAW
jgi:hypothetical protein